MELGRCPACGTGYEAADVAAYGVLRPRSARNGGPYLLYACDSCGRRIRLIPHGQGRYAPPGQPPPPPVPDAERRPPWLDRDTPPSDGPAAPPQPEPASEPAPEPPSVGETLGGDAHKAMELLGVGPEATREEITQAFRTRSKTCHPDKVAHLDVEFQELATAKFRLLREAFELLVS